MILEKGNMWDIFNKTNVFLITTNPIIRKDGAVVMGRGIALEAKTRFPSLPYDFGKELKSLHPEVDQANVGIIGKYENTYVGFFMVKHHWREPASLNVIRDSVFYLKNGFNWRGARIDLNFPGIGNGRLDRSKVLPFLEELPDNVHVWEFN